MEVFRPFLPSGPSSLCALCLCGEESFREKRVKTVNIAMLGSGFVADFYLQGLSAVNGQQVVVTYSRSKGRGRVLWVRSRESHGGPHTPHFWDVSNTGGGAMADLGCHTIELARYAFGKEDKIVEVMAWGANLVHRRKTKGEDNALLVLKFSS